MTDDPAALNDAQVRHAVRLFYDALPPGVWEDGLKPSGERLRSVVVPAVEDAPPELRALLDDANPGTQALQAGIARIVLDQALAAPHLQACAREAIAQARLPNMAFDPITGIVILGVLLATTKVDHDADGAYHVHFGAGAADILGQLHLAEVIDKLPALIKALPASLLEHFA